MLLLFRRPAAAAAGKATARRPATSAFLPRSSSTDAAAAAAQTAIAADDRWPASLSLSSTPNPEPYDAIVVGLGAHGSSALYHLARRFADGRTTKMRRRVLGIEAHPVPGHSRASHGGDTRITRQAYFESPLYVPLLKRSAELTSELEALVKTQLFWRTGVLHAGGKLFEGALQSALKHGVEHEALRWGLDESSTKRRWPGVNLPDGTPVLWEPGAGVLAPEKMIRAHVAAAVASGAADVLCGEGVVRWGESGDGSLTVETSTGRTFTARSSLILAAGAWMPRLVPELAGWAVPRRYTVAWLEPGQEEAREQGHYALGSFPPFLIEEPGTGVPYYGFPAWPHPGVGGGASSSLSDDSSRRNAVKLGVFLPSSEDLTSGGNTDPGDSLDRAMRPEDEQEVRRFADACLPGLRGGSVAGFSACIFTDSPDSHFLLDFHPLHAGGSGENKARVVLCSACSGHGFKLSPAVGEALADMAVGGAARRYGNSEAGEVLALHRMREERPGMREVLERFGRL